MYKLGKLLELDEKYAETIAANSNRYNHDWLPTRPT